MSKHSFFYAVLFCLLCSGCSKTRIPIVPPVNNSLQYYLALGDSYTIGQSVSAEDRFPSQAVRLFNGDSSRFQSPVVIAQTGWTTSDLLSKLSSTSIESKADFVTLLIGVNNQFGGRSFSTFEKEFDDLLLYSINQSKNRERKRIAVLSIPNYGLTPFARGYDTSKIRVEVEQYNAACKRLATARNIAFLDLTYISDRVAADPSLTSGDGLHPSAKQYGLWAKVVDSFARKNIF